MPKLTLTFKGKPIRAYKFNAGDFISIGRADENEVQIDSLAVAPIHAEIEFQDEHSLISQKQNDFPVLVNNSRSDKHKLKHGDQITIGKHVLYYTEDSTSLDIPSTQNTGISGGTDHKLLDNQIKNASQSLEGQLQIMNGPNIGRVVSLKGGLTRLGKPESGVAVIAKRKDGFYIAPLEKGAQIKLNNQPIREKSLKLTQGDLLEIDGTEMQFFLNDFITNRGET